MHWNFMNEDSTLEVNLEENSSTGDVWGTVSYKGYQFPVSGAWEARGGGGIAARKTSILRVSGQWEPQADVPVFVAATGLLTGEPTAATGIDLAVQIASSANGDLEQAHGTLNLPQENAAPAAVTPTRGGEATTGWTLSSLDGSVTMEVLVGGDGRVTGNLHVGEDFAVEGRWAASGSVAGRNASAFQVFGTHEVSGGAYDLVAAAGIMTGSGVFPQKIEIMGSKASISQPENETFQAELLPMYSEDQGRLASAYAESYMVIQMGGTHGDSQAVAGWRGPTDDSGKVGPFGNSNYPSAGTALSADELAGIASPDPNIPDTNDIKIPAFQGQAATRPVMIQFVGDKRHFPQPPLQEYHEQITGIFYDDAAGALVLQFADVAGGQASSQINFNEGRGRNHNSVIIEPR